MHTTDTNCFTIFEGTFSRQVQIGRKPVAAAPSRNYRAGIAALVAIAVITLTTAAGAFSRSHNQSTSQNAYSATYIKLSTAPSFEDALY